jgi:type II restriction/modification system DNA methylase subunit YeeA
LLGKIYEKLNAIREDNFDEYIRVLKSGKKGDETKFNKDYGVYYTPRVIVHYMCQESLISYLERELNGKVQREDIERFVNLADTYLEYEKVAVQKNEKIKHGEQKETKYEHIIPKSIIEKAKEIDNLLANIKVCDPAVGSGAFLVGMLHEIVKLAQLLSVYLGNEVSIYDLKRQTIENSLYGVDIDPGAVEICKLRLWLSLVVDEDDFYNIKPLPNLDYKIVKGNSLVGFPENWKSDIAVRIEELENKLFSETHPGRKNQIKEELDALILKRLENSEKNFGYKIDFDFRLFFPRVFKDKGGFDIVIGNPPYVKDEKITPIKPILQKQKYEVYTSGADLFVYFYEKGYQVLKERGILAYITSNKWMRSGYGQKLRKFLKENTTIVKVIDFSGYRVFKQTVDTCIIVFRKEKPPKGHMFEFLIVSSKVKNLENYLRKRIEYWGDVETWGDFRDWQTAYVGNWQTMLQEKLSNNSWSLGDDKVLSLKEKIEKVGKPLKEWDVKIYRGITTGYDKAFIIDTETRNRILANCRDEEERKRTEEIIKPVLRGRDIERYRYKWAELWVICTFPSKKIDIEQYPALKEYLASFGERLLQDGKPGHRKKTPHKWYETQDNIAYYPEFEKEKIVWQRVTRKFSFCLVPAGMYILDSMAFLVGGNLKYLLGVLNSTLVDFYVKTYVHLYGDTGFLLSNQYVERIPIPPITPQTQPLADQIVQKVDEIHTLTQSPDFETSQEKQEKVKKLEREIDRLVYKLYGLNEEKIKIIEGGYNG